MRKDFSNFRRENLNRNRKLMKRSMRFWTIWRREYFSFGGFLKESRQNLAKKGLALAKKAALNLPRSML